MINYILCPHCNGKITQLDTEPIDVRAEIKKLPLGGEIVLCCHGCGHYFIAVKMTNYLDSKKLLKDDFDSYFKISFDKKKLMRDYQETVHFNNGHWG